MTSPQSERVSRRRFVRTVIVAGIGSGLLGAAIGCQSPAAPPAAAPTKEAPKPTGQAGAATAQPQATQAPAKPAGKVALQIWQVWSGKLEESFRAHVKEFESSQNEISVAVTTIPLAEILPKLLAAVAAGAPPDTWTSSAMIRPELVKDGHFDALDKYMKWPDDMLKLYDPQTLFNGARYGIPLNGGLWVNYYSVDLYTKVGLDPNKPPQTWDDIIAHGQKLSDQASNQFAIALPNKPIPWTTEVWYGYLLQAGGEFLSADNSTAAFNAAPGVEALQFWVDLTNKHKFAPQVSLDSNGLRSNYQTGKIGMIPNYPVTMDQISSFTHKSMTTPAPTKARQGTHFAGTYFPFMTGSKNKEQVARFFEWWVKAENQAKWAVGTGGLPIRQSVTEQPIYKEFLQKQPMAKAFIDSFDFAKPLPMVVGITEMEQVVSEAIELAIYQRATPKDALDQAAQKVNDVIKKYKT